MLSLSTAIAMLQQCLAGLHHVHALGIIHRDIRAANVLIAARDPLQVVLADFGVSHRLRTYAEAVTSLTTAAGGTVGTVLHGDAALCPAMWVAPEVLVGEGDGGRIASPASDVYMFGGLMFEVLTSGLPPYHWMSPSLVWHRRLAAARVPFRPTGVPVDMPGLRGLTVVEAAEVDGVALEWRVSGQVRDVSRGLVDLMKACQEPDPKLRPTVTEVLRALEALAVSRW